MAADVDAEVKVPSVDDILAALVAPPEPPKRSGRTWERPTHGYGMRSRVRPDYLQLEARNAALGAAGEEFVIKFEQARLISDGQEPLAASIEHISRTQGEGAGFDVLSFESSGQERLIEVKTTKYGAQTPFYVSRNEVRVSDVESERYHLYRVFAFREAPRLYSVPGSFSASFVLDPTQYIARFAIASPSGSC